MGARSTGKYIDAIDTQTYSATARRIEGPPSTGSHRIALKPATLVLPGCDKGLQQPPLSLQRLETPPLSKTAISCSLTG